MGVQTGLRALLIPFLFLSPKLIKSRSPIFVYRVGAGGIPTFVSWVKNWWNPSAHIFGVGCGEIPKSHNFCGRGGSVYIFDSVSKTGETSKSHISGGGGGWSSCKRGPILICIFACIGPQIYHLSVITKPVQLKQTDMFQRAEERFRHRLTFSAVKLS